MKKILALSITSMLLGCATAHKMNMVGLGMTKAEVIQTLGKPVSVSAQGKAEYLNYSLCEKGWPSTSCNITTPYYVRLVDGKVESYGRMGDFDSTKDPRKIIVEREDTINADINSHASGDADMYTKLMKIKQLREEGILTEEEFQQEKRKILKNN
ncbi:MAG: SHOCT domain-containing protein [Kiritimatiellales bacterium]